MRARFEQHKMATSFNLVDFYGTFNEAMKHDIVWKQHGEEARLHENEYRNHDQKARVLTKQLSNTQDEAISNQLGTARAERAMHQSKWNKTCALRDLRPLKLKKDMLQDELTKFADDWSKSTIQKELADTEREIAKYEKQIRAHDADMLNLHINNLPDITEKKGVPEPVKPAKFFLPELSTDKGYRYAVHSPLGLVQLPNSSLSQDVSIEAVNDPSSVYPSLKCNEILITPIVCLCPQEMSFDPSKPAIVELMKSVVPTDANPNRQLVPIYTCSNPVQWKELVSHDCKMLEDRIKFKATQFGYVSVIARFPFPSGSVTIDPKVQKPVELEVKGLPSFKMVFPPVSVQSITNVTATIRYEDPQVADEYLKKTGCSLASACVMLEPHNTQFQNEVKITLPIPNYSKIKQKYPHAELKILHSKSTKKGVPTEWEAPSDSFTIQIDDNGNCLVTTCITHFSWIAAIWSKCKAVIRGLLNFFVSSVCGHCQVFMSDERLNSSLTFGVAVLFPCQQSRGIRNYPYCLYDSVMPIEIRPGDVECQIDMDDLILQMYSGANNQKYYRNSVYMSHSMRAEFIINLNTTTMSCNLPAGPIATLRIKHGSEEMNFNLLKPVSDLVSPTSIPAIGPSPAKETLSPPPRVIHYVPRPIANKVQKFTKAIQQLMKQSEAEKVRELFAAVRSRMADLLQRAEEMACDISGPVNSNFVDTMLLTVELSKKIETLSRQVEEACTDKRLKKNIGVEVDKIPVIAEQLKRNSRRINNGQNWTGATARETTDLLITNANNLVSAMEQVLYAVEGAMIKVPLSAAGTDSHTIVVTIPEELANSKSKLCVDDLVNVQNRVWDARSKWYNLGLQLGLKTGDLDAININNKVCGDCFREVLVTWLTNEPIPSWYSLIEALKRPSVGVQVNFVPSLP